MRSCCPVTACLSHASTQSINHEQMYKNSSIRCVRTNFVKQERRICDPDYLKWCGDFPPPLPDLWVFQILGRYSLRLQQSILGARTSSGISASSRPEIWLKQQTELIKEQESLKVGQRSCRESPGKQRSVFAIPADKTTTTATQK